MPNYVKQNVSFLGEQEQIENLFEFIKSNEGLIDFEKIIPMPPSLKITSGSSTDLGILILNYRKSGDDAELRNRLNSFNNIDELINYYIDRGIANLSEAQQALNNIELYGAKDWHSWSCSNWGTKWNAGNTSRKDNILSFETAWSVAEPILVKLSKLFPELTLQVEYADEDIGSNCGEFELLNGVIMNEKTYDGVKSCEVWGYDPADFFIEIKRDRKIDDILKSE
jgi:hypothetical protein